MVALGWARTEDGDMRHIRAQGRELGHGVQAGLHTQAFLERTWKGGREQQRWAGVTGHLAEATVGKDLDIYRKYVGWCQSPGFIVREKTNPTTETRPPLRFHTERNDFPIKPVLLDINI